MASWWILSNILGKSYTDITQTFQKMENNGPLNSFYEANIILIPKSDKGTVRKENYGSIFMNIDTKILNKY